MYRVVFQLNVVGNECLSWRANMPLRNNKLRSMKNGRGIRWGHKGVLTACRTHFMETYVCSSVWQWEWSGWLRKAILRMPQYWHSGQKTHIGRLGSGLRGKNGNSLKPNKSQTCFKTNFKNCRGEKTNKIWQCLTLWLGDKNKIKKN